VRCGGLLRASSVYERIFSLPSRLDEAIPRDFATLRLHLLLSGPSPNEVDQLLARELDPTEKRQLQILKTERQIFDACVAKVEVTTRTPRPDPTAITEAPKAIESAPKDDPLARLEGQLGEAMDAGDPAIALAVANELGPLARQGSASAVRARELLNRATEGVAKLSLKHALVLGDPGSPLVGSIRKVADLARTLETGSASMHPAAKWMNQRALGFIEGAARFAAGKTSRVLASALEERPSDPMPSTIERVAVLRDLAALRSGALAQSAASGKDGGDEAWERAISAAEETLAAGWARWFAAAIKGALASEERTSLAPVLAALEPELVRLDEVDEMLSAVTGKRTRVKHVVAAPHLGTIVRAALLGTHADDRRGFILQIRSLEATLRKHGLAGAIKPEAWLEWTAESVLGAEAAPKLEQGPSSYDGYRALRAKERRTSISCLLAEVALMSEAESPNGGAPRAAIAVEYLSETTRARAIDADLSRVERAITYLSEWFGAIEKQPLTEVAAARVYDVLWDEEALARFSMELDLVREIFPEAKERALAIERRVAELHDRAERRGIELLRGASEAAWSVDPKSRA
jgi:hypothetical protein